MDATCRRGTPCWGVVTVEDLGNEVRAHGQDPARAIPIRRCRYTWRPSAEIEDQLPPGFCLALDGFAGADGIRHLVPTVSAGTFIVQASLGGSVLLSHSRDLSGEQRFSYHAMRLLYQQAPRLREHFDRAFSWEQDLYMPKAGRIGQDDQHVLPPDVGLDAAGSGEPWKPSDLVEQGRARAVEADHRDPDAAACIRFGLLEAGRRAPLDPDRLSEAEARQMVRLALFDLGPGAGPSDEDTTRRVMERLLGALERHLGDDTETFNRWFFANADNLIHQVAKKKRPGGPVPRETVRQAFLEAVFQTFTYVGDCVHLQMLGFREALPGGLNEREQALFNSLYLKQHYLGGLPMVLLHDRFDFLRGVLPEIWNSPQDRRLIGVLLRLLQHYGSMASTKREADRRYKQQRHHRNRQGKSAQWLELDPARDALPEPERDLFQEIAGHFRELRGMTCRCPTTRHWRASTIDEKPRDHVVALRYACGECGHEEAFEVTTEEFRKVGEQLMANRKATET